MPTPFAGEATRGPSATVAKIASATMSCQNAVMSAPFSTIARSATRK